MAYPKTHLEDALSHFLKTGEVQAILADQDEHELKHQMVELAVMPGYSKSNADALWIHATSNQRLGFHLTPGEQLKRFFELVNVHPRDVITSSHMTYTPERDTAMFGEDYINWLNRENAKSVKELMDLVSCFAVDQARPPLCKAETALAILENAWGGLPMIAGWASALEILNLDLSKPVTVGGHYQVGIYDFLNGSGHMESDIPPQFTMNLAAGDLVVLATKSRWTPDTSCGFVNRYYRLQLETQKALVPA